MAAPDRDRDSADMVLSLVTSSDATSSGSGAILLGGSSASNTEHL